MGLCEGLFLFNSFFIFGGKLLLAVLRGYSCRALWLGGGSLLVVLEGKCRAGIRGPAMPLKLMEKKIEGVKMIPPQKRKEGVRG